MNRGLANIFMRVPGKDHIGVRWAFGVFANDVTEFGFDVLLQSFANINLFAGNLVTHGVSSFIGQPAATARGNRLQVWLTGSGACAGLFETATREGRAIETLRAHRVAIRTLDENAVSLSIMQSAASVMGFTKCGSCRRDRRDAHFHSERPHPGCLT